MNQALNKNFLQPLFLHLNLLFHYNSSEWNPCQGCNFYQNFKCIEDMCFGFMVMPLHVLQYPQLNTPTPFSSFSLIFYSSQIKAGGLPSFTLQRVWNQKSPRSRTPATFSEEEVNVTISATPVGDVPSEKGGSKDTHIHCVCDYWP